MLSWRVVRVVLRHPPLWGAALGALGALARRRWWTRPPFLPVPDPALLRWRIVTAYGDPTAEIAPEDVVAYLAWWKRQRRTQG